MINTINQVQVVQAVKKEKRLQEQQTKMAAFKNAFGQVTAYLKKKKQSEDQAAVFDGLKV